MWTYLMASSRASTITARQNARYNEELNASRLLQSSNFQIPRYHRTPYQTTPFLKDGSRTMHTFRERYQMSDQPPEDSSTIHNCTNAVNLSSATDYDDRPFDTCDKFLFPNELQQQFVTTTANSRRSNQFISATTQTLEENETEDRFRYKSQILNGRRDGREKLKNIQENDDPKLSSLHRTINALRRRLTYRKRTELEKKSSANQNKQSQGSVASDGVSSLLSFDPSLPSYYRWLAVVSLAVFYNIIFVVGRAIFWEINKNAAILWYFMDYLADLIYVVDILVHCHEGYLEQGLLVREANKLRTNYIKTSHWRLDLLSMLPTDLAYIWWAPDSCSAIRVPCPVIVRLNRLFRMPRMWEFFERTETATSFPNAFRICKVVLAILVLIHWNACLYFAISYALGFGSDNWVYNLNGAKNSTLARQYIYSFYWSTLTLTTIGETPTPESDAEMIFVVADFLAGVLIFATIVGNIGSMISNMNVSRVEFQNRMDGVKQYMQFRKVGDELEARVIRYFAYTWSQTGALDEERVLAALPDKLKAEIAIRVHMSTLKQVRIFQDCEPGLLEALVLKLRLQVFSPGDYICRKGDVGKEMYIVKRGRLSVVADDGLTVFASLGAGSVFGEVSVLEIAGNRTGNRRTANVKSTGYSDLFCLAKRDLWETLADYPEARSTLTERGCQLLRKDGLLDEAVFANSTQQQDTIENGIIKLENTVENLNLRLARLLGEFSSQTTKLKQRITKLEEKSSQYLTQDMECQLDEETIMKMRATRLRSIQLKPNLNSSYDQGESESFDDDKNLSLTRKNTF